MLIAIPTLIFWGLLSDKIGRKPIILGGMLLEFLTYSPSAFRGRTMAIFHMSSVVMTLGSMLAGTLAALVGAQWAVASMGATGALLMVTIGVALPRARLIR